MGYHHKTVFTVFYFECTHFIGYITTVYLMKCAHPNSSVFIAIGTGKSELTLRDGSNCDHQSRTQQRANNVRSARAIQYTTLLQRPYRPSMCLCLLAVQQGYNGIHALDARNYQLTNYLIYCFLLPCTVLRILINTYVDISFISNWCCSCPTAKHLWWGNSSNSRCSCITLYS